MVHCICLCSFLTLLKWQQCWCYLSEVTFGTWSMKWQWHTHALPKSYMQLFFALPSKYSWSLFCSHFNSWKTFVHLVPKVKQTLPRSKKYLKKKKKVQASATRIKTKACLLREINKENVKSNLKVGLQSTVSCRDTWGSLNRLNEILQGI